MIDERTKELISEALDGELAVAEQTELDTQLSQSEELRRYFADMKKLNNFLAELPTEALPDELHDQIIRNIQLPATRSSSTWNPIKWPGIMRFAFPVAAALLVAVGIFQIGSDTLAPEDLNRMIGTVAPGQTHELGAFSLNSELLNSMVTLQRRNSTMVLNVELDSDQPVELNIDLSSTGLVYEAAVAKTHKNLEFFTDSTDGFRARSRGRQKFAVLLHRANDTTSTMDEAITLEYFSDGKLIQKGTLSPKW